MSDKQASAKERLEALMDVSRSKLPDPDLSESAEGSKVYPFGYGQAAYAKAQRTLGVLNAIRQDRFAIKCCLAKKGKQETLWTAITERGHAKLADVCDGYICKATEQTSYSQAEERRKPANQSR